MFDYESVLEVASMYASYVRIRKAPSSHVRDSSACRRCGYTVSKVANGSVRLVHETSVKHYKDDLTFTLTDKKVWNGILYVVRLRACRFRLRRSCSVTARILVSQGFSDTWYQSYQRVFILERAPTNCTICVLMKPLPFVRLGTVVAGRLVRGGGILDQVCLIRSYVVCAPLLCRWTEE